MGSFEQLLDRGADWAWDASVEAFTLELGREPTAEERARGRGVMRGVLGEFLTPDLWRAKFSRTYAERFTADELAAMIDFFGSPAGRKMLQLDEQLTQAVDDSMSDTLGADAVERFIARLDEALMQEFGFDDESGS